VQEPKFSALDSPSFQCRRRSCAERSDLQKV